MAGAQWFTGAVKKIQIFFCRWHELFAGPLRERRHGHAVMGFSHAVLGLSPYGAIMILAFLTLAFFRLLQRRRMVPARVIASRPA
jgi:hypothetical protein